MKTFLETFEQRMKEKFMHCYAKSKTNCTYYIQGYNMPIPIDYCHYGLRIGINLIHYMGRSSIFVSGPQGGSQAAGFQQQIQGVIDGGDNHIAVHQQGAAAALFSDDTDG